MADHVAADGSEPVSPDDIERVEPADLGEARLAPALAGLVDEIEHDEPAEVAHLRAPSRNLTTTSTIPHEVLYPPRSAVRIRPNKVDPRGWRNARPGEVERQWQPGNS